MRTTLTWLLLGVFAVLAGQPSEAGSGDHQAGTSGNPRSYHQYVAMGDSFTAGAGIRPGGDTGCYRSQRNYPTLLADRLHATLHDASCGGATAVQVESPQQTATTRNPPQLADVDDRTDLVTISLGLNDTGYGTLLMTCMGVAQTDPSGSPCRTAMQTPQGDQILSRLEPFGQDLAQVIRKVQHAGPNADVVVVGYPQLAPPDGSCPDLPFAAGDYGYLAEYLVKLNKVMEEAADKTGARFVDVLAASKGHDVCAGHDAWVLGNLPSPRSMVWHPFANEEEAIAALVYEELRDQ
jgi:lysophospholipase L1-like esterase